MTPDYVIVLIKLCPEVGNDEYIIVYNFSSGGLRGPPVTGSKKSPVWIGLRWAHGTLLCCMACAYEKFTKRIVASKSSLQIAIVLRRLISYATIQAGGLVRPSYIRKGLSEEIVF